MCVCVCVCGGGGGGGGGGVVVVRWIGGGGTHVKWGGYSPSYFRGQRRICHVNQSGAKPNLVAKILATNFGDRLAYVTKIGSQH